MGKSVSHGVRFGVHNGKSQTVDNKGLIGSRTSRKNLLDYVIRRFNLSSARLNKPQGLDLR
jgi:hypothetical protein